MWQFCGKLVNCLPLCFRHPNRIFLSNGKHPWSRGCSLNRGPNVYTEVTYQLSFQDQNPPDCSVDWCHYPSYSNFQQCRLRPVSPALRLTSSEIALGTGKAGLLPQFTSNPPVFSLAVHLSGCLAHRGKNGHTWVCFPRCLLRVVAMKFAA